MRGTRRKFPPNDRYRTVYDHICALLVTDIAHRITINLIKPSLQRNACLLPPATSNALSAPLHLHCSSSTVTFVSKKTGIGDALEDEVSLQCQYYHHAYRFLHNLQACHSIWDNTWSEHGMKPQVYCHCETVSIGGVRNLT